MWSEKFLVITGSWKHDFLQRVDLSQLNFVFNIANAKVTRLVVLTWVAFLPNQSAIVVVWVATFLLVFWFRIFYVKTAIADVKLDFIFLIKKVLGQEGAWLIVASIMRLVTIILICQLSMNLHQLSVGEVDSLSDWAEVGELVFMVQKAKLLAHFVFLSKVYRY